MKINKNLIKLAIICTALSDAGQGATTPALATISAAMPTVSPALIQMISSITALFIAITPVFYAKLILMGARKRVLLTISAVLFIVGGMGPFLFNDNIWIILFFRALLGIASGISFPLSVDLVVDFFEGKERRTMTGFVSATVSVSGVLFQLLGGYLAGINWTYTFLAYGLSIIFVVIWAIFLPEPKRQEKVAQEIESTHASKKLNPAVYLVGVLFGVFFLLWYIMPNNGAIVLVGEGIAVPAQIGAAFSMITVGSFVVSILHGPMFKVIKFALLPLSFALGAIGLYICFIATTLPLYSVGITFTGLGMGMIVPATMTKMVCMTSYTASPKAISLAYFAMGIGGFLQPIVFSWLGMNGVGRMPFLYGAVAMVVFCVVMVVVNILTKKQTVIPEYKNN